MLIISFEFPQRFGNIVHNNKTMVEFIYPRQDNLDELCHLQLRRPQSTHMPATLLPAMPCSKAAVMSYLYLSDVFTWPLSLTLWRHPHDRPTTSVGYSLDMLLN